MTVGENENEEDQPLSAGQNEVESSWILSDESSLVPSLPQEWRPVNRRLSRSRWASRRPCTLDCPTTAKTRIPDCSVGVVHIDIPHHPGVLHGMMTRGSKQLSSTLQEFRVPRMASRNTGRNTTTIPDELDKVTSPIAGGSSGVFGANSAINNPAIPLLPSPPKETPPAPEHRFSASGGGGGKIVEREATANLLLPLVTQFFIVLQRLSITAALLPSLQAQYQMEQVVSAGVTGSKAKFDIDLPRHSLSFTTKLQITENLPPSASIELPQVHVGAEYLQDSVKTEEFVDGVVLCRGNYLSAVAEIGTFEHSLTTDLLNHLVFVQKVFMAEVNDVLNKVSGGDKTVPLSRSFGFCLIINCNY